MKKEVILYVHRCPECGWEAIRGEKQEVNFCSSCGYKGPPVVDTKTQEFDFPYITKTYEEDLERYRKSAEYLKRLEAGEDPADLDSAYGVEDLAKMYEAAVGCSLVGNFSSIGTRDIGRALSETCVIARFKVSSAFRRNKESY